MKFAHEVKNKEDADNNGTIWTVLKLTRGARTQEHYENMINYYEGEDEDNFLGGSTIVGEMLRKNFEGGDTETQVLSGWNYSNIYTERDNGIQVRQINDIKKKLNRKTEKTYGWDFNAAGKELNKN